MLKTQPLPNPVRALTDDEVVEKYEAANSTVWRMEACDDAYTLGFGTTIAEQRREAYAMAEEAVRRGIAGHLTVRA